MKRNSPFILTAALSAVLTFTTAPAPAETWVSGDIAVDTAWTIGDSPYVVTSDVTVRGDATLTIDPGVEVRFDPNTILQIGMTVDSGDDDGTLIAIGDPNDPDGRILFTSNTGPPGPGDWRSIHFENTAVSAQFDGEDDYLDGSVIRHATVEYAGGSGGLYVTFSAPYLYDVQIRHCDSNGVRVEGNGSTPGVRIENNHISYCADYNGGGVYVSGGSDHKVRWNTVEYCTAESSGGGIAINSDFCYVNRNTVRYNEASYGGGIAVLGATNSHSVSNELVWNSTHDNTAYLRGGGVFARNTDDLYMFWEWIQNNTAEDSGGGVEISDSHDGVMTNCNIRYNQINSTGADVVGGIFVDGCERLSLAGDPNEFWQWSNNIAGNEGYQLRANYAPAGGDYDIDATYVLWCTDDPSGLIYDNEDDTGCAMVYWDPVAPFFGDFNGDGIVTLQDLAHILAHYGTDEGAEYGDGDLDGDGDVDLADLAALLSAYGNQCL